MKEKICALLQSKGWMSAGAIAKRLKANRKTISLHLQELEQRKEIKSIEAEIVILRETMFNGYEEKLQKIKLYKVNENGTG
ncbi:MAG: hypothetical protein DRP47_09350 [Candidatus Zixiibacteriota bacterium]|nr:MAG: hypothetical protein DRP47_09350 [candidate division Zixibacteria bacterium]